GSRGRLGRSVAAGRPEVSGAPVGVDQVPVGVTAPPPGPGGDRGRAVGPGPPRRPLTPSAAAVPGVDRPGRLPPPFERPNRVEQLLLGGPVAEVLPPQLQAELP